jgi:gluconate 2-dehydrogenase gamma chain
MSLTPSQLTALRALLDRVIPADDFPGALAAGTDNYVLRQLATDCAEEASFLLLGLTQLDAEALARHGPDQTFATLLSPQQDALLADLAAARPATAWPAPRAASTWFHRLVDLAHEGFYADPANGGNHDAASWRMLGYEPGTTPKPTAP